MFGLRMRIIEEVAAPVSNGATVFCEKKMQEYVSTTQGCNSLCNLQIFSRGLIDVKHLEEA
jgi:hypothetical protein